MSHISLKQKDPKYRVLRGHECYLQQYRPNDLLLLVHFEGVALSIYNKSNNRISDRD